MMPIKMIVKFLYDKIFQLSSVFTPLFIGITAGALTSGEMIHPDQIDGQSFYDLYVHSWLNMFSVTVGIFMVFTNGIYIFGIYYW